MKNNKRYFISFTVILSIVMFSFISSVAVFASENIFTDGTELDISENKKTNEYSNAIVHTFQRFRAPFSAKIVHIFPEQSAVI